MTRIAQPEGRKGSLKWIQRAVNERWSDLNNPILIRTGARRIEWVSPLVSDDYAEYRDDDFLDRLGVGALAGELRAFWPARGPQWDALGKTDTGDLLLVEAKAHVGEMCSPATSAKGVSLALIEGRLEATAGRLGVRPAHAPWAHFFYQLGNRVAHLEFLRSRGQAAWLVLVNFTHDVEVGGPTATETWRAAYEVAFHVMGLPRRHALSRYILEVFPDVRRGGEGAYVSPVLHSG